MVVLDWNLDPVTCILNVLVENSVTHLMGFDLCCFVRKAMSSVELGPHHRDFHSILAWKMNKISILRHN